VSSTTELPDSLWAATAGPAPRCPPLEGQTSADVCVVGAGFTGLSAALHLAKRGASVIVLEAAEPGWGASGRNGGQVIAGLKLDPDKILQRYGTAQGERVLELAGSAPDLVFDLIQRHSIDCHAERCGWIQPIHSTKLIPNVEARVSQWQSRDAPVEMLDPAKTADLLGTNKYVAAMLDRRGGKLQPLAYARGLCRAAQSVGISIHGRSSAVTLETDHARWCVKTPDGSVTADQVLLCTNGYTDALWPGLERSVIPVFSYQVATRPLSDNLRKSILPQGHVAADTRRLLVYFRIDHTGRLVVGGRGKFKDSSKPTLYRSVTRALRDLFPQVSDIPLDFFWGGRVALTVGHVPHLNVLAPGLLAGLGYNGRGVAMATAMGTVLADHACGVSENDLAFPATALRPISLHRLRRPVLQLIVGGKKLLDALEVRGV